MDTSETYIKQCEKATEIQKRHFDFMGMIRRISIQSQIDAQNKGIFESMDNKYYTNGTILIWLPRQDQLQEIIHDWKFELKQFSGAHGLLQDFAYWVEEESQLPCASMEQLWLAFVMSELYHKKWYNGEWRIENDRDNTDSKVTS